VAAAAVNKAVAVAVAVLAVVTAVTKQVLLLVQQAKVIMAARVQETLLAVAVAVKVVLVVHLPLGLVVLGLTV
jgi:hypothetical protein